MSDNKFFLDDRCIDMLKEVGNICTGNAAIALSQVINQQVKLEIPDLKIIHPSKILESFENPHEVLVGININLLGKNSGNIVLMLPEKSTYNLIDGMSPDNHGHDLGNATEYGVSIVKEIGNIVISAYLVTLSSFIKTVILHSIPSLVCGTLDTIFTIAFQQIKKDSKPVVLVETFFYIDKKNIKGSFFLIFEPQAIQKMIDSANQ